MPAAAVIRRGQALSGFIGRKESRRRPSKFCLKDQGLTLGMGKILDGLKVLGGTGTVGEAVKCVDINRNTNGEGRYLGKS